ncbi:MAG: carboxymuconolactone decarboxylase family protein [Bacteroidales bacterium]|nr:carboxymuconolactone decarboxylase family protein [Bacteroidales bacterium]MDZ4204562.1 carboxymuconolactone decarboxylase family protein [Bacteroidales bacterium]
MAGKVDEFNVYRQKMNDRILSSNNLVIKRIYNIDTNAYQEGALPVKTKEMLGLVSSLVLRCDDCVRYHLIKCHENGVTENELFEILAIGNLVGGTIVIPHTRRAVEFWDELCSQAEAQ